MKFDLKIVSVVWRLSLPPRGAWIEIKKECKLSPGTGVAPPAGSVD